jgi:hypothetical protein
MGYKTWFAKKDYKREKTSIMNAKEGLKPT